MRHLIGVLFVLVLAPLLTVGLNERPIIGILTVPFEETNCVTMVPPHVLELYTYGSLGSCFWSYYVQWIEEGGSRVAVIPYDMPHDQLKTLFSRLNGILFTGGEQSLLPTTPYYQTALYLYNLAIEANQAGDYFPVWGTCEGFQLLNLLTSNNQSVLIPGFNSENYSIPLNFTDAAPSSRMFSEIMPENIRNNLATKNITLNLHSWGVDPTTFMENSQLSGFYTLLSTNVDRDGNPFVSSIEGINYPVYGTQWHPERPQFEWKTGMDINHSKDSTIAMQYMADFLTEEAKKNNHTFPSKEEEEEHLIYAYSPVNVGNSVQVYVFPPY